MLRNSSILVGPSVPTYVKAEVVVIDAERNECQVKYEDTGITELVSIDVLATTSGGPQAQDVTSNSATTLEVFERYKGFCTTLAPQMCLQELLTGMELHGVLQNTVTKSITGEPIPCGFQVGTCVLPSSPHPLSSVGEAPTCALTRFPHSFL